MAQWPTNLGFNAVPRETGRQQRFLSAAGGPGSTPSPRPTDQSQLVRLGQVRMGRDDPHAQSIGTTLTGSNISVVEVSTSIELGRKIQVRGGGGQDGAVVLLTVVCLNRDILGRERTQMHDCPHGDRIRHLHMSR